MIDDGDDDDGDDDDDGGDDDGDGDGDDDDDDDDDDDLSFNQSNESPAGDCELRVHPGDGNWPKRIRIALRGFLGAIGDSEISG